MKNNQVETQQFDISFLSNHLWEAANILRGPVDAADFKTYIFPLLFFKRISDVYDEEVKAALEESDGDLEYAQFSENHRFQIPEDCHVSIHVYNLLGQGIRTLVDEYKEAKYYVDIRWDGTDDYGRRVSSSVYLLRMQAGDFTEIRKMTLMR